MAAYYLDSSALVKHFAQERGSSHVSALVTARDGNKWRHIVAISRIGQVEVAAAIAAKQRTGMFSQDEQAAAYAHFTYFSAIRLTLLAIGDDELRSAASLTQIHPLHGYDAVHLATAMAMQRRLIDARLPDLIFLAADRQLLDAAISQGLAVDDPNAHE